MNFKVASIAPFLKEAKRLIKKYPSLKAELNRLADDLSENPEIGTPIGRNCYKIRLSISSKGKGKSGGARIITHVFVSAQMVFLLSIYDKSEQGSVSNQLIHERLKFIKE